MEEVDGVNDLILWNLKQEIDLLDVTLLTETTLKYNDWVFICRAVLNRVPIN